MTELERLEKELRYIAALQKLCDEIYSGVTKVVLLRGDETWDEAAAEARRKQMAAVFKPLARPKWKYHTPSA